MKPTLVACSLLVTACGATSESSVAAPKPTAAADVPLYTAYVRGPLAEPDLGKARAYHDRFAGAGAQAAHDAGDRSHHVLLGTGEPAGGKDEFLALDEWLSLDGPRAVYGDPQFQAGFSALFASAVAPELYRRRPDWVTWGELAPPDRGAPYWIMIVKGHLAKATDAENQAAHDAVAGAFKEAALAAGDIAHVPHVGIDDPRIFFNVDVSTNHAGMLAVLGDPKFQEAFGQLFDAPPEVRIYRSSDWKQW